MQGKVREILPISHQVAVACASATCSLNNAVMEGEAFPAKLLRFFLVVQPGPMGHNAKGQSQAWRLGIWHLLIWSCDL